MTEQPTRIPHPVDEESELHEAQHPDGNSGPSSKPNDALRNSEGWDGKLRVDKQTVLSNPELLTDPDPASSDENVIPGEQLDQDEGTDSTVAKDGS